MFLAVRELLQAAKALYRIYATYHAIFSNSKKRMFSVDITAAATQRKEYNLNQNCNNCVGVVR